MVVFNHSGQVMKIFDGGPTNLVWRATSKISPSLNIK